MEFREKLRRAMQRQGLNQQQLARKAGVSDSEVSRILGGKSRPGLDNALRLARAVGVSLDFLADEAEEVDPSRGPDSAWEQEVLEQARAVGLKSASQVLLAVKTLGLEESLARLMGRPGRAAERRDEPG
jgi:transcriptional regulator with XRE-family HTH domain